LGSFEQPVPVVGATHRRVQLDVLLARREEQLGLGERVLKVVVLTPASFSGVDSGFGGGFGSSGFCFGGGGFDEPPPALPPRPPPAPPSAAPAQDAPDMSSISS
jgi:hypothetical protein